MSTNDLAPIPAGAQRTSDPERIRALAHPVRLALLEYLEEVGEATATQCAKRTGETVANCSFHLRLLGRYGYIEPARPRGRERPWRPVERRQLFAPDVEVPGSERAVVEFAEIAVRQETERFIAFLHERAGRSDEPAGGRGTVVVSKETFWATPDEAAELNAAIAALIEPFVARTADASSRPAGARHMRWFATSHADLDAPAAAGPEEAASLAPAATVAPSAVPLPAAAADASAALLPTPTPALASSAVTAVPSAATAHPLAPSSPTTAGPRQPPKPPKPPKARKSHKPPISTPRPGATDLEEQLERIDRIEGGPAWSR